MVLFFEPVPKWGGADKKKSLQKISKRQAGDKSDDTRLGRYHAFRSYQGGNCEIL